MSAVPWPLAVPDPAIKTSAEIAATVENLRLSITNSMRFGESARMAEDAGGQARRGLA
jgi:hypothetical protein